ncbi:fibronectin type III domain-containing protein [Fulvivirga ligni]|uniref:fibronectin type III domain-containing protein n=1 Tax=Fulvivirga ligni TaxID=2904246 RepID=UPI001F358CA7|nr:hypothetical protein [Fulvivirga ligni]UII23990.1 hypothetical protein LVD16_12250 [Fulvivirga ligni]
MPYSLKQWKSQCDTTNVHVATAAQVLLGEIMMKPQEAATFSQKLLASEEQENRLALGLYSAEFNIQAANGLAFRYVDKGVEKDGDYFYRVVLASDKENAKVLVNGRRQKVKDVYEPKAVMEVKATGEDGEIIINWPKQYNDNNFSGYLLERSADGKSFVPLMQVPFKTLDSEASEHIYADEVDVYQKTYYYRIRGITSFADLGSYSVVVSAHAVDLNGPPPPSYVLAKSTSEKTVDISWKDNPDLTPDHAGYFIARADNIHGPFTKINDKPFKTSIKNYTDANPIPYKPNFYVIIAVDKLGNEKQSVAAMAILEDHTPPSTPEDMIGVIDSLGLVSLAWPLGNEEDLMGYRVYRADHPDAEYLQVTNEIIPGNYFLDTIPLNTLTRKVYYKVAAFDFNFNPSPFSSVLELERPDYIAPVKPVINDFSVVQDTIHLYWAQSSSKDVAQHILWRKQGQQGQWMKLAEFNGDENHYADVNIESGQKYSYALEAIDKSKIPSGKGTSVAIKSGVAQVPMVQNLKGQFDQESKQFILSWTYQSSEDVKFVIYRGQGAELVKAYGSSYGKERSFADKKFYLVKEGYTYQVKVITAKGVESDLSDPFTVSFK